MMKKYIRIFYICATFVFLATDIDSQVVISDVRYKNGPLFYYIHTIRKNETLSEIAQAYRVLVKEILEVNTIADPEKIKEGDKIKVPNYSLFIDRYPHDKWSFVLYSVKKGEKLKQIAKNFKTDVDDIKEVNFGIGSKPVQGTEIRVPVPKPKQTFVAYNNGDKNSKSTEKDSKKDKKDKKTETDSKQEPAQSTTANPALTFQWGESATVNGTTTAATTAVKPADKTVAKTEPSPTTDELGKNIPLTEINIKNCKEYVYERGTVLNVSVVTALKKEDGTVDANNLSFIQGALLAVNDMKSKGLTIKLNSFDISREGGVKRAMQSDELLESNLIIAQIPYPDLRKLATFAKEKQISLVIPYESRAYRLPENNPYVIQAFPSDDAIYSKLTGKNYDRPVSVLLVRPENADSTMLSNYRTYLKKNFGSFNEHNFRMGQSYGEIRKLLAADKQNLVFVCSNSPSDVETLLSLLNVIKYPITVYGRERWQHFRHIVNHQRYFDLNLHLVNPFHIDYQKTEVKQFVRNYRKAYSDEPFGFAFLGYDIFRYFLETLKKYGPSFTGCFTDFTDFASLQSRYRFKRFNADSGFVNDGCFLLEYTDGMNIESH